jgi:hypothetical protein
MMRLTDPMEDPPLVQIANRYFELLKGDQRINPDLIDSLARLFESGKLGSYIEVAKILKPQEGVSDEDPGTSD